MSIFKKIAVFLIFSAISTLGFPENYIFSNKLKNNMEGYALTVFKGEKVEKIPVKIIGVLKNVIPGENRVIIRVKGDIVEKAGIVQGMSGSPVYINNKLAGAISFGWAYGKEPIGGLTPIESMLEIENTYQSGRKTQKIRFTQEPTLDPIFNPDESSLLPENLKKAFNSASLIQSGFTTLPFESFAQGGTDYTISTELEPGSSLAVALVRGDISLYSIGTVTFLKNNRVFGYGHPIYNLGDIAFPMHTAKILTVYPSVNISNKIGVIGKEVGTVVEDRSAGIMGIIKMKPSMIPVNIKIALKENTKNYNFEIVNHEILSPYLTNLTLNNILQSVIKNIGFQTYNIRGKIEIENHNSVNLESISANIQTAPIAASFASLVQSLIQNPFQQIKIKNISIEMKPSEKLLMAQLIKVKTSKTKVNPGDNLHLQLYIKPFQQKGFIKNVSLIIPKNIKPGNYKVTVGDGYSIMKAQSKNLKTRIETLDGYIRLVNRFLKPNKVYISISKETDAFFMGETVQSSLPQSIKETVSDTSKHIPKSKKWKEALTVNILTTDFIVNGFTSIPITVAKK
jgi:hypothetical protein